MGSLFHLKPKLNRPRKFRFFRLIKVIIVLLIAWGMYTLGVAISENVQVNQTVKQFKARAQGVYTEEIVTIHGVEQVRRYYEVPRETYELEDTRSVFQDDTKLELGQKGDIFVSQDSPFPDVFFIHQFISYYFGGHAAIHDGEGGFIEAVGFPDSDESLWDIMTHPGDEPHNYSTVMKYNPNNYWLYPDYRDPSDDEYPYYGANYRKDFIGLRVKNITSEQIDGAVDFAMDKVDRSLYNFWFFLDMDYKYYCTDLVSRAYQDVMIEPSKQKNYSKALNDDGFITSVNDMVLSDDTYIIFYVEIKDGITHIYHLADM